MVDVLKGLCLFAGAAVLAVLAIDIGITAYHRVNGTPTAEKILTEIVKANEQTINSLRTTVKAQQSEIKIHKQRLTELETKMTELQQGENTDD